MSVGDAIIAATALKYRETLAVQNAADFNWINGLEIIDPMNS